jgi:hypothetical protein
VTQRPFGWCAAAGLLDGCTADLLPGEAVLGDEVAAVVVDGDAGSELGRSVALLHDGFVAGAPGAGEVRAYGSDGTLRWTLTGGERFGQSVFVRGEAILAWEPGRGVWRSEAGTEAELVWAGIATAVDVDGDGEIRSVSGEGEAIAVGPAGEDLHTRCGEDGTCTVDLDGVMLAETSAGSPVGWTDGVACWGDPGWPSDPEPGAVRCADGLSRAGLAGDHLGTTLGPGWAMGVFDKWLVPARARVVALDGSTVWAIDRAAEKSVVTLDSDGTSVVVGAPGSLRHDAEEGRVYFVADATP